MKRILQTIALMLMLSLLPMTVRAQIFLMDYEETERVDWDENLGIPVPPINMDDDWIPDNNDFVPIDGGVSVLAFLGGFYLLRKKCCRNNQSQYPAS